MTQSINPHGYMPRIVDAQIEQYLKVFGAVEIAGTKWCGKTWSARKHGASIAYLDQEGTRQLALTDAGIVLQGDRPRVLDEWQRVPQVWDAVRHEVDAVRRTKGAWILTGSSSPKKKLAKGDGDDEQRHSGAGRIGRIRMAPMSLAESGDSKAIVSLAGLFDGAFKPGTCEKDTVRLVELACRGGWPEAIESSAEEAQLVARAYLDLIYSETVPDQGMDPFVAERLVGSIARNLGQSATYATIAQDIYGAEESPQALLTDARLADYLQLLRRLYLLEEVPGWAPPARSKKRFLTKPKRYLADPSLACAALGISVRSLIDDWQTFGLVFENLCMRDLGVYARALPDARPVPLRYYHDDSGLEADVIIELADGRWAAIEVKVGEDKVPEAIKNLSHLEEKVCSNPRAQVRPPEFKMVLVGVSEYARKAGDNVYVVPLRLLGA